MPGNPVDGVFHYSFILCGREGWKGVRGDYGGGEVHCHVMFLACVKRKKDAWEGLAGKIFVETDQLGLHVGFWPWHISIVPQPAAISTFPCPASDFIVLCMKQTTKAVTVQAISASIRLSDLVAIAVVKGCHVNAPDLRAISFKAMPRSNIGRPLNQTMTGRGRTPMRTPTNDEA